jgi:hypothetical protein
MKCKYLVRTMASCGTARNDRMTLPPEDEQKPCQGMFPAVTVDGAIQRTKAR